MGIRLPYKALQLKKAYKIELIEDDTCIEDITFFHKYYVLRIFIIRPRYIIY